MKTCGKCKQNKPFESFNFKNKEKGTRQAYCRDCNKAVNKEHYKNNKSDYASKRIAYRKINGNEVSKQRLFIHNWFTSHPCVDCGESDPIVLSFDHIDRKTKSFNISAKANVTSIEVLQAEIDKCDVVCLNCHARRTAKQFNWYKNYK